MPAIPKDDAQILLVEMQPEIVASVDTVTPDALCRAVEALKAINDALGLPILASVVRLNETAPRLIESLGALEPVERGTIGVFEDVPQRDRLSAASRKVLAIGGVSSEIGVFHAVLGGCRAGYEVHVLADCCGGLSARTEAAAFRQMEAAGARLSSVSSFFTGMVGDMGSEAGRAIMGALATLWSWDRPAS